MKQYAASNSLKEGDNESPGRRRKTKSTPQRREKRERKAPSPDFSPDDDEDDDEPTAEDVAGPSSVQKYVEKLSLGMGLIPSPTTPKTAKKRGKQKKDSESSSEEERWLDAIQSGKLEEVDEELKKVKSKDPKLMTARQRAMLERKCDHEPPEQLMSLPSGYKEVVMTEEEIQRKALKSLKRKEKADEKREKDKKKTMERLLKKQDSKTGRGGAKRGSRRNWPVISYISSEEGPRIVLPPGVRFPLEPAKIPPPPPARKLCGGPGCSNPMRYSCSKTGVPLCSLQCYQQNIDTLILRAFS